MPFYGRRRRFTTAVRKLRGRMAMRRSRGVRLGPVRRAVRRYTKRRFRAFGTPGRRAAGVRRVKSMQLFTYTHREYITDILSSGAFQTNTFRIQPAVTTSFPWLSALAVNFEEYRFKALRYRFNTISSDALNSANTALGVVIMATQHNALAPPFTSKQQMENYEFATSCKPSRNAAHPVDLRKIQQVTAFANLYIDNVGNASGDRRLYDVGTFTIATQGMQMSDVPIGELWCEYTVQFFKPKLISEGAGFYARVGAQVGFTDAGRSTSNPTVLNLGRVAQVLPTVWNPAYNIDDPTENGSSTEYWTVTDVTAATGTVKFNFPPTLTSGMFVVRWWYTLNGSSVTGLGQAQTANPSLLGPGFQIGTAGGFGNNVSQQLYYNNGQNSTNTTDAPESATAIACFPNDNFAVITTGAGNNSVMATCGILVQGPNAAFTLQWPSGATPGYLGATAAVQGYITVGLEVQAVGAAQASYIANVMPNPPGAQ